MNINVNALKFIKSSHWIYLLITILSFSSGCKKNASNPSGIDWNVKKNEIQNKVRLDITNVKALLPFTISKSSTTNAASFNNEKINEYYKTPNVTYTNSSIHELNISERRTKGI